MKILVFMLLSWFLQAQGIYGPGLQADSLANTTLGPNGNQVSLRFRAVRDGNLQGIRPFIIWSFRKAGYHGGTGGTLKVEIQADDGSPEHRPSGRVLASNVQRLFIVPASDQFYPLIPFDRAPRLQAGTLYHAVFSNTHPESAQNFVSINALFTQATERPVQPTRRDEDWAMLIRNQSHPAWALRRSPGTREGFTPILEIYDAAGAAQGVGYMEVWMGAARAIAGTARVGERFTVAGPSRKVASVAVRVRRLAGSGPLQVRLESAEGGGLVAEGTCPGPGPGASPSCSLGGCGWLEAAFPAPPTLESGRSYRLVLSAAPEARFEAFPLRKGADKGFTAASLFADGHAEFNDGKGWQGWEQWGQARRIDSDLQFYFRMGI